MNLTIALVAFVLFAVLTHRFGTDSRDGRDWKPRQGWEAW